ncbi:homoserine O-acetyltransferase MetX [Glutamicibacter endophyticus]|uniref:homoserine O-acetyltransferase MetX n=1 Tax=Glutamicibacter endophyticus TaxID=1522174 RepID=UPI003AEFF78B
MSIPVTTEPTYSDHPTIDGQDGIVRRLSVGEHHFETGGYLPEVELAYETFGTLNAEGSNAVLVLHALTGDAHVATGHAAQPGWWADFVGPGLTVDTDKYFVLSVNMLGGCNGSTGPSSHDAHGRPYGSRFPFTTIRDAVHVEAKLADVLGIDVFHAVMGGSMGGARALEWAVQYPDRVRNLVVMAATGQSTAEQIAFAQVQIESIRQDPYFAQGDYYANAVGPDAGLGIARKLAHITYRSEAELEHRFGRTAQGQEQPLGSATWPRGRYQVESYLDHQAGKLVNRFDANSYVVLTEALMSHDIARGFDSFEAALARLAEVNVVIAAVRSDRLYFPEQSERLAAALPVPKPVYYIDSPIGHDGFLTDAKQLHGVLSHLVFEQEP